MNKKIVYWSLITLTGIIILLLLLLPGIAKHYVVNHSKELVGRQIALEKLKINFFKGTVTMIDFKMYESDDTNVFVSFDTLLIDAEPYRYISNDLVIEQFYLKGLKVKVVQNDSIFNFDDLVTFFSSEKDSVKKDTTANPLHFKLSNIELKSAEFTYTNRAINKTTKINDLSFFIPYIGWDQKGKSEAGLKFNFKNEGYFQSSIDIDPVGGDFEAKINVYHLYLDAFKDYVASYANINSIQGTLNSNFKITGNVNKPEKSIVSGSMEVLDFLMTDKQDKKFLAAKKMLCKLKSIDSFNSSYIIDSLNFSEPYVYFRMENETNNFFEIFNVTNDTVGSQQPPKIEVKTDSVAATPLKYAINHLIIQKGIVDAANYENVKQIQGILNSNITITGDLNSPEKSIVSGSTEMLDFLMKDKQDKKFLGAKKMECKFKSIDYFNSRYIIDSLTFSEPYVYFRMDSVTNNFFEVFNVSNEPENSKQQAEVKTNSEASPPLYYAINHFVVKKGILDYADNLTGEIFDFHLSDIKMNVNNILSSSDWIKINSKMLLNKRGTLVAEVGVDPANPYNIILDYTIKDFQLSDLNIYSKYYMGFPIVYGDMYYKSHTEIIKNQLSSENKLIIQNAELGNKTGGLYDLPMKFALFLLEDKNGIINLDIPVRGDLNDPTVSVGKIVWNTFKNLIVKVGTAPVNFLAGLISVDPKDIKSVEYSYLDTAFTAGRQMQLDKLLELEKKKDGLSIELVYFNDTDQEKRQITVSEAGKLFMKETGKNYQKDEKEFADFLKEKTKADSVDIMKASKAIVRATLVDSLSNLFEQSRINSLKNYLHTVNDSTQIRFIGYDPKSPKNVGSIPQFETKYLMTEEQLEKK